MNSEGNFLEQPTKKETLAIKQEKRLRRINHLRKRLPGLPSQWWVGMGEIGGLIALFLVNLWLLLPFFGYENRANVFSAPVVPALVTFTERFVPFTYGVRVWLLVFLILFPLSFYYFVKGIAGRKSIAFLATLLVVLPIRIFLRTRVELGLLDEDGAHIASLTFTPLISLLLLRFLRSGKFWRGVFVALGTTLVALTSPIGSLVLAVFMGIITFSEMLLGRGRLKLLRLLTVLILAAGFAAFWYHPKFILLTINSPKGQLITQTFSNLLPVSFFVLPLLGVFGFLLFENRPQLQSMFIAFFLTISFGLFSLGAGVAHTAPSRFLPAFGISFAFLIGVLVIWLFDFLRTSPKLKRFKTVFVYRQIIAWGLIGLIFVLALVAIIFSVKSLWSLQQARVLGLTAEQKVGLWEIKERTTQLESVLGYTITGLTAIGVFVLKIML